MIETNAVTKSLRQLGLGPIGHIAFVVDDIRTAAAVWSSAFSVGPFVLIEHVRSKELLYRGQPSDVDYSLAFASRGALQIELLQQHNEAPSVFRAPGVPWRGVHHVGIRSQDVVADEQKLVDVGMVRIQRGVSSTGTITCFMGGGPELGIVELVQSFDGGSFANRVESAAAGWDGTTVFAT
ncbi:VOC family protein [Mesorhizobium sp. B3-1-3]|uniref:VOC family protein n=1 Tax=unclassified Mesorhizobium TaxID=325217 RepID=UPI00112C6D78|nr:MULTISPECIES: VOC family protein [unclassified Mesorhizobium]TPI57364.1 VOC family protein [Mesorhizobium sp. B3-1-8]TPI63517.1 VOC family protein [Mesorhizobium sp. B3-1-3]